MVFCISWVISEFLGTLCELWWADNDEATSCIRQYLPPSLFRLLGLQEVPRRCTVYSRFGEQHPLCRLFPSVSFLFCLNFPARNSYAEISDLSFYVHLVLFIETHTVCSFLRLNLVQKIMFSPSLFNILLLFFYVFLSISVLNWDFCFWIFPWKLGCTPVKLVSEPRLCCILSVITALRRTYKW